jgi:hypothetical protein
MSDRRSCHHHQRQHVRQVFDDRCRALDDELKRKTDTIDSLRYGIYQLELLNDNYLLIF